MVSRSSGEAGSDPRAAVDSGGSEGEPLPVRAYRIADACKVAGLGRTTIYAALKSGALPARKCGRRTLILAADLESFLDNLPAAREFPKGMGDGGQGRLKGDVR
jgi:excisionase family DNA binding protein